MAGADSILREARSRLMRLSPCTVVVSGGYGRVAALFIHHALAGSFKVFYEAIRCRDITACADKILGIPEDATAVVWELESASISEAAEFVKNFPPAQIAITGASGMDGQPGAPESALLSALACQSSRAVLHYNRDDEAVSAAAEALKKSALVETRSVGFAGEDVAIKESRSGLGPQGTPELSAVVSAFGEEHRCHSKIFGRQNARGMAFAFSVARELGVPSAEIRSGIAEVRFPLGAGGVRRAGCGFVIDESRGANFDSASRHIKDLVEFVAPENTAKLAILGGMGDQGADLRHQSEVTLIRACLLDGVYLIGKEWDGIATEQTSLRGKWDDVEAFMRDFDPASLDGAVTLVMDSGRYDISRIFRAEEVAP